MRYYLYIDNERVPRLVHVDEEMRNLAIRGFLMRDCARSEISGDLLGEPYRITFLTSAELTYQGMSKLRDQVEVHMSSLAPGETKYLTPPRPPMFRGDGSKVEID